VTAIEPAAVPRAEIEAGRARSARAAIAPPDRRAVAAPAGTADAVLDPSRALGAIGPRFA
jgi:hypothetical protein